MRFAACAPGLQFESEFGGGFGGNRIVAPEILKILVGGEAADFRLVDIQFAAQMVGFVLEDAGRPAVQMFLMLFAIFILPAGGDVEPALAYRLIAVEAQAAFVEAAGFGADRLVAGVDDDVEWEFGRFTRVIVIVVAHMVFHHGKRQSEADLGCGETYARRFDHGDAHGFDELVKCLAAQLAFVGCGLLAQYQGFSDINMGRGAIVIGLAAVIIGEVIFGKIFRNFALKLTAAVIGAIIYYIVMNFVLRMGLSTDDLKLLTALVVAVFLTIPYWKGKYFTKVPVKKGGKDNA